MVGNKYDILHATEGLHFRRYDRGSAYLHLEGANDVKIRFTEGGHIASSAARYGAALTDEVRPRQAWESWWTYQRRTHDAGRIGRHQFAILGMSFSGFLRLFRPGVSRRWFLPSLETAAVHRRLDRR